MHATTNRRRQRGLTLVELSLVLVGAMALIAIGAGLYRSMHGSSSSLASSGGLMQISAAIKSVYPMPEYAGLTNASLIATGNLPGTLLNSAGTGIINPWGGTITVAPFNYGAGTNNAYSIQLTMVPRDGCNRLLAAAHEQFSIIRNANASTPVKDDTSSPKTRYTQAAASAACANVTNTLVFVGL